jgi:hypothetical protein
VGDYVRIKAPAEHGIVRIEAVENRHNRPSLDHHTTASTQGFCAFCDEVMLSTQETKQ